ncbi:uncharacterized protein LOC105698537 [Orussus abietinus]|uniref:uncharacterized protein LOC105698537 n=1 Tax=Orussus abietinus TaxID=222816 RepID=UPI00062694A8|nr:uncharacterized protein LOC105698537 [Orussus abietinus]
MTRFARAKGSKASNERVPDDGTPWHVMKQQLQDSLAGTSTTVKPKTAKQLLEDKSELFYSTSRGNVNNTWADFEEAKSKSSKSKNIANTDTITSMGSKKEKKLIEVQQSNDSIEQGLKKNVKHKFKKDNINITSDANIKVNEKKLNSECHVTDVVSKYPKEKSKKKKMKSIVTNDGKIVTGDNMVDTSSNKIKSEETCGVNESKTNNTVNEKKRKKRKREASEIDRGNKNIEKPNGKTDVFMGKRSKRQKRNLKQKEKRLLNNQVPDTRRETTESKGFDVADNNWNNYIKSGKQEKTINGTKPVFNKREVSEHGSYNGKNGHVTRKFPQDNKTDNNKRKAPKIRDDKEHKRRKPDLEENTVIINGRGIQIVPFDRFPVLKEDAERLKALRQEMIAKGIPLSEIKAAMKLERRKAEKALARVRKQACFHCRKGGHNLSDCPELDQDDGSGICYKCGSTEHTHFECRVKKGDEFGFAKCFICREQGHIARQCPDNPKGLYPNGGACKICGDVTHLKKDCPDLEKEKQEKIITIDTIKNNTLECLEEDVAKKDLNPEENKSKSKVIKF